MKNKLLEDFVKVTGLIAVSTSFFQSARYLKTIPMCSPYSDFLFYGMGIMCMFTVGVIIDRIWDSIT